MVPITVVETCSDPHSSLCWVVVLSFLGLGLLVGWVVGYYTGRKDPVEASPFGGEG